MSLDFTRLGRRLLSIQPLALSSLGLRGAAMVGKFSFVLVAALKMSPADLGRYGVATSLAMLIPGFVGIEAYQIVCRAIANLEASDDEKATYGSFTLAAAAVAFVSTLLVLWAMRWSPWAVALGAAVVGSEHLGNELFRILVAEGRRHAALQCFSIRSGLWSLGLPILAVAGVVRGPWSLNLVLEAWLFSGLVGLLYAVSLPAAYRPSVRGFRALGGWLTGIWKSSAAWLAIAMSWRFIDSGPRLIAGLFLAAAEAGRFTFLNTISGIPTVVIKGVVEPMFFVDLAVLGNIEFRRRYFLTLGAIGGACVLLATLLLFGYSIVAHRPLSATDWITFALLSGASLVLNLSQAPHFILYANRHDRLIFYVSLLTVIIAAPVSCLAAWQGGRVGLSAATLFMALTLLGSKSLAARLRVPKEFASARRSAGVGVALGEAPNG